MAHTLFIHSFIGIICSGVVHAQEARLGLMMKTRSMCWKIGHTLLASALLLMSLLQSSTVQGAEQGEPGNNADLLIVVGAGGEASYGEMFLEWANAGGGRRGSPSQS